MNNRQKNEKDANDLYDIHPNIDDLTMWCAQATMLLTQKPMITLEELSNQLTVDLHTAARIHHLVIEVIHKGKYH